METDGAQRASATEAAGVQFAAMDIDSDDEAASTSDTWRQTMDSDPSKRNAFDIKGAGRQASMNEFNDFVQKGANFQLMAVARPIETETAVRLVCVRHAMGRHNDAFQWVWSSDPCHHPACLHAASVADCNAVSPPHTAGRRRS
jgi:hypothetical protein